MEVHGVSEMRISRNKVPAALWRNRHGPGKALLAALVLAPLAAWTGHGTPVTATHMTAPGVTGAILSGIRGKCLTVRSPAHAGHYLVPGIYECSEISAQRWTLPGDNTFRFGGQCLAAVQKTSGTGLVLDKCDGSGKQFWEANGVVRAAGTEVSNPWSGKCMTAPNGSTVRSTQVRIYACKRSAAQTWYLPPH